MRDLIFAARQIGRSKASSALVVLILAVGIAGTTAMFALIQGVLLRPLPMRDQAQLIVAWKELPAAGAFAQYPFGSADIDAAGREAGLLQAVAGVTANGATRAVLTDADGPAYATVSLVTGRFFEVLGLDAAIGRTFTADDDLDGAEPVLVISHRLWRSRYGAARDVVGRRVQLGEQPFTIVGVMPPDVDYPHGTDMWRTTRSVPATGPFGDAARREIDLLARLRPGVSPAQATEELAALTRRHEAAASPNTPKGLIARARPLDELIVGDIKAAMLALLASVVLILLIASANVANLLLIKWQARQSELAVRAALGGGYGAVVREVLAESLLLALAAGAVGLLIAWWAVRLVVGFLADGLPRAESVRLDGVVIAFALLTAFATAFVSGLLPAVSSMRGDIVPRLRGGGKGTTDAPPGRLRAVLVVVQVALAVTVMASAGLLTRSFLHLQSVDTGLAAERLVFVNLTLPSTRYSEPARQAQFLDDVTARLEGTSAIAAVTPVNVPPFSGEAGWDLPRFTAEGQGFDRVAANPALNLESVRPNYFGTFDVAIRSGRSFTSDDREHTLPVAIVSEDVAERTWPGQNPIGKRLKMGAPDSREPWLTVVGIAAPTRYRDLTATLPTLYLPAAQFIMTAQMLAVRVEPGAAGAASALIREGIRTVDPQAQVVRIASFEDLLAAPLGRPRFHALLFNLFGLSALLLTSVGVYSVMATYVRQRDRELAIRQALGATSGMVRALVMGQALRLVGMGAALGVTGAVLSGRVLRQLLLVAAPFDPFSLMATVGLLVVVSAIASWAPARRASRLAATATLRAQ